MLSKENIRISNQEIISKIAEINEEEKASLEFAAKRIRSFHKRQLPKDHRWKDSTKSQLGWFWRPISRVGLYVPGGLASYPSSVLMNAIPAKVAGVKEISVVSPTPQGKINPLVLLAAKISGVTDIFRVGGAQAIAALAYGTETISPVNKITGPGNAFVAEAKRQVFGKVGIDMIAGPSEVLIIADENNDPSWIAMDLMSQAEHDEDAQAILITTNREFGGAVATEVNRLFPSLKRKNIAYKSWKKLGAIFTVNNLKQAAYLSDCIAPEHLQLCIKNPDKLMKSINNAGSIFLGKWTPEAIGDYVSGTNHVLPTERSSKFSSGLSVLDFMKRTSFSKMNKRSLIMIGNSAEVLATSEGLQAHKLSISLRLKKIKSKS